VNENNSIYNTSALLQHRDLRAFMAHKRDQIQWLLQRVTPVAVRSL